MIWIHNQDGTLCRHAVVHLTVLHLCVYRTVYGIHIPDKVRFMSITDKVWYIRITDKVRYTHFVYNGQKTLVPTGTLYARLWFLKFIKVVVSQPYLLHSDGRNIVFNMLITTLDECIIIKNHKDKVRKPSVGVARLLAVDPPLGWPNGITQAIVYTVPFWRWDIAHERSSLLNSNPQNEDGSFFISVMLNHIQCL